MRDGRCWVSSVLAVVLLGACGAPSAVPAGAPSGPTRAHWQLSYRVPEPAGVRVVAQHLDDYSESTRVSFGKDRNGAEVLCSVMVSAAGWGGPENKVGQQLPATVQGRPALRNGAGAEGDYLTWQRADGDWAEAMCEGEGQRRYQDRLAAMVTDEASTLVLPFRVSSLPRGLRVSSIEQDRRTGETKVHLGGTADDLEHVDSDLLLTFDAEFGQHKGRATVIAGYPASLDETPKFPGLCLAVQGHDVCVDADSSDTGPYPDRSDELPVMVAVAEALRFPAALGERSSWYPAQDVFG